MIHTSAAQAGHTGAGLELGAVLTLAGALLAAVLIRPTPTRAQQQMVKEVLPSEQPAAEAAAA